MHTCIMDPFRGKSVLASLETLASSVTPAFSGAYRDPNSGEFLNCCSFASPPSAMEITLSLTAVCTVLPVAHGRSTKVSGSRTCDRRQGVRLGLRHVDIYSSRDRSAKFRNESEFSIYIIYVKQPVPRSYPRFLLLPAPPAIQDSQPLI